MAGGQPEITLKPGGWSVYAAEYIGPLAADRPGGLDRVREMVLTGRWALDYVEVAGALAGVVVTRSERDADGLRLVILYAAGGAEGVDMVADVLPLVEARARRRGCLRASFWTRRAGLVVKAQRAGYGEPEMMLEKGL